MLERSSNRIAKNTLFLYCRMILTMGISLYTSRVVLNALGISDYGVYNVVGGVVAMLGFFNSSIGTSTQRFLNVGMADNSDNSIKTLFSTAINAHFIIGIATVLLLETVGLWFVMNKLVIPEGQHDAAIWVYQCSVMSFFISIISAPYNAAIVAYERMSVFAIMSIIEVLLKLGVAFGITYFCGNRLKLYALFLLIITLLMRFLYSSYCSRNFAELRYKWAWNWRLIKQMMSFSGWMIFGCFSDLLGTQGINMMINVFFGPIFNAARAIAVQVQGAIAQFTTNFMISVNPQIVKSYAAKDYNYAYQLVFSSSKISFFLMLTLTVPIILRSDDLLLLWLDVVPQDTSIFVNIILIEYLIRSSYTPIAQINQASGNIKMYQLAIAGLFLMNFIFTYVLFKCGFPVYSTFILSAVVALIGLGIRLLILKIQQQFPVIRYLKEVSFKIFTTAIISFGVMFIFNNLIPDNRIGLISILLASIVINILLAWMIGFNQTERIFVKEKVRLLALKLSKMK